MTHGIMFHYFHSDEIAKTQGSISAKQFEQIIEKYSADHNLLSAFCIQNPLLAISAAGLSTVCPAADTRRVP